MNREQICVQAGCYDVKTRDWGAGPWDQEPDRVDFNWFGLPCFVHRNSRPASEGWTGTGAWCGYVGVGRKHPAFGHDYDDVDVSVHGGLTFASKCSTRGHLCHVGGVRWWLGFDCGHAFDLSPAMERRYQEIREKVNYKSPFPPALLEEAREITGLLRDVYRDLPYVIAETKNLAVQLARFRGANLTRPTWRSGNARDWNRNHERMMRKFQKRGPKMFSEP